MITNLFEVRGPISESGTSILVLLVQVEADWFTVSETNLRLSEITIERLVRVSS